MNKWRSIHTIWLIGTIYYPPQTTNIRTSLYWHSKSHTRELFCPRTIREIIFAECKIVKKNNNSNSKQYWHAENSKMNKKTRTKAIRPSHIRSPRNRLQNPPVAFVRSHDYKRQTLGFIISLSRWLWALKRSGESPSLSSLQTVT